MKYLIINADDFGHSRIFNEEILDLIDKGLISSTSFMVDREIGKQEDQIERLVSLSKENNVSIGLHLEFKSNLNFKEEIERQYNKFVSIFNVSPTHIDVHRADYEKEAYPFIESFCVEKKIFCRNMGINQNMDFTTSNKRFDGTLKTIEELKRWIESLKEGSYEIIFHPGKYDPDSESSLNEDREKDVENIIKLVPTLKENDIKVISYLDLKKNLT